MNIVLLIANSDVLLSVKMRFVYAATLPCIVGNHVTGQRCVNVRDEPVGGATCSEGINVSRNTVKSLQTTQVHLTLHQVTYS